MEDATVLDLSHHRDLKALVRANPLVSRRDRWFAGDPTDDEVEDIWHLDGFLPGYGDVTISWEFAAPDGIIDVLKLVAASLFLGEHPRYDHRTANLFAQSMKYLAAFMVANDYDRLDQLDEAVFERFRTGLTRVIARPSENAEVFIQAVRDETEEDGDADQDSEEQCHATEGEDRDPGQQDVEPELDRATQPASDGKYGDAHGAVERPPEPDRLTVSIVQTRIYAWFYLKEAAETLARFDIAPAHNPFETASMRSICVGIAAKGLEDVEPLPDAVAIPILNAAARMLGKPADDIIRLQTEFLAVRRDTSLGSKRRPRALRELILGFEFSPLEPDGPPWREPIALTYPEGTGSLELRRLVRELQMAALVMLLAGTGVRISEACSVEVDDREIDDGLPSCIESRPSLSEQTEHFWLHGFLSKNQGSARPSEWLLGARPQMAHGEPMTVRAIRVLEALLRPWRRMASTPELRRQLQVSLFGPGLPNRNRAVRWIRGNTLLKLVRDFYASVGLKDLLADAMQDDARLRVYAATDGRCIHHHQWRHTYYEFMVRLDPRLLPAVSLHFKHTSLAATQIGYGSKDASVREAKDSVRVKETVRSFTKRRFGTVAPVGNMARELERERAALERMVGDIPGAEAEKRVEAFVVDQDIRIWPADHGSCLMALNPTEAACRKAGGTVDFRAIAPDLANRTPSLCCGCPNFSVGKENIPYWRRRYVENRTSWIEADRNPLFRVALRNATQAAAMLRALGEPIPLILRKPIRRAPIPDAAPVDDTPGTAGGPRAE